MNNAEIKNNSEISKKREKNGRLLRFKRGVFSIVPIIGLALLLGVYILLGIKNNIRFDKGIVALLNTSVVCAVVATGAIFIYTLGSFDISLGAATLVSAMVGAMAYNATKSLVVMFIVCIAVAVAIELISSLLAAFLNLPVFITTVAMMSVLSAFSLVLIKWNGTGESISIPFKAVKHINTVPFKLGVLAFYLIIAIFAYEFTGIGRKQKFLGGNPLCAKLTGISMKKMAVAAFALCGVGIGLGAILTIVYAPTVSRTTASGLGMNVILAIVFGGMPVSGGSRSKITAALIGAFTISLLDQIMLMLQLGSGIGQIIKAAIFLIVVVLTSLNYRGKLLAR